MRFEKGSKMRWIEKEKGRGVGGKKLKNIFEAVFNSYKVKVGIGRKKMHQGSRKLMGNTPR